MAGPSNLPPHVSPGIQELYLHALNANVSNFVSVKLSSNDNYRIWKKQMLCLMETHDMCVLVDVPLDRSRSTKIMKQYDSLLKGWIFGSISQEVLGAVVDLGSAKDVWDKLKSFYAPNSSFQQAQLKPEAKEETKDKGISTEIETKEETKGKGISTEIETKEETKGKGISTETKEDHITTSVEPELQPIPVSGPGPMGPGPTRPGPTRQGPMGPGPTRQGPMGPGPTRQGPMGPGPTRQGPMGPPPARQEPMGPPPARQGPMGPPPARQGPMGPPPTEIETKGKGISTETKEDHITTSVEPELQPESEPIPVSGPGPIGPGPIGPGPIGPGPIGPGPIGPGPIGPGPIGQGPMGPGPTRQGPMGPGPTRQGPMGPGPTRQGPMGPGPTRQGPMGPGPTRQGPMGPPPARQGPMGPPPARQGPMGPPPARQGPMGPPPALQGPMGPGPMGLGPMGPRLGPTRQGPMGPGPMFPGPIRRGPGQRQRQMMSNPPTEDDIERERQRRNTDLKAAIKKGNWYSVSSILKINPRYGTLKLDPINEEASTILHLAVEKGQNNIIESLLGSLQKEDVKEALEMKNVHGNTALQVAAILGNEHAARLLVVKHYELLEILDNQNKDPLFKACSSLQFDTGIYLLKELKTKYKETGLTAHHIEMGVELVVNAISAKQYSTASNFVRTFPELATKNDQVLMAIARTFPSGQSHEETDTCPDLGELGENIIKSITTSFFNFIFYWCRECCDHYYVRDIFDLPKMLLSWVWQLIFFLISIVFLPFVMLYFLLWKGAKKLASYMNRTKEMEWEEAKWGLKLVCDEIDKLNLSGIYHPRYTGPILEAACQNAYEVVDEILSRSPEVIKCQDECGYDIIQLAVIHRSDKIYNRIYQNAEGNNQKYKTIKDSSQNNMLHLAGRLAPSHKLNGITGAALQLQRELQWREELKKFVFPSYITQENIYKETPGMVFTREHENLVKEGEKWMKTTAESCSITAGLITTIVFAAAITVPGGNNQEKGNPLFSHDVAFIVFAISDAVSLFTSTITLLVFLSILTARFSEQDFLVNLPRRLIIGLCALLVSTTAMMVAFGAILFLVFCNKKPWMLVPICASVCLTILFSFFIQIPLIVDLYRSTYVPIFGNKTNSQHQEDRFDLYEYVANKFFE